MSFDLTPGNTDDRKPMLDLFENLKGIGVGDKGYISKEDKNKLADKGLKLITKTRKNMKKVYNEFRPHQGLQGKTPLEYLKERCSQGALSVSNVLN